ncbi:unnamed protein product, partial [Prorocentrum cordatum]
MDANVSVNHEITDLIGPSRLSHAAHSDRASMDLIVFLVTFGMVLENIFSEVGDPSLITTRPGRTRAARCKQHVDCIASNLHGRMPAYAEQAVDSDLRLALRLSDHCPIVARRVQDFTECVALPRPEISARIK